jgi:hypothetical protein
MKTALLTIGSGPLACAAYEELCRHSDLRAVIFSRRAAGRKGVLHGVLRYGLWYSAQQFHRRIMNGVMARELQPGSVSVPTAFWSDGADQTRIAEWLKGLGVELVLVCGFHHRLVSMCILPFCLISEVLSP